MNGADIMPFDGTKHSWRNRLNNKDLGQFARAWFAANKPIRPPQDQGLHFIDGLGTNLVLFRNGQYQVQLGVILPHTIIPPHTHPNHESYEVYLSGEVWFKCDNHGDFLPDHMVKMVDKDGTATLRGFVFYIGPNDVHSAYTTEMGGSFLSIQKWADGVKPTCVARDWAGEQVSDGHGADIINKAKITEISNAK